MSRNNCEQLETLYTHRTEIELLKRNDIIKEKDMDKLQSKVNWIFNLLITSLVGIIIGLISLFVVLFEIFGGQV